MIRRLTLLAALAALLGAGLTLSSSPARAVNGCIPSDPANPQYQNACSFTITPGGAYNASAAASSWSATVRNTDGFVVKSVSGGPGRTEVLSAAEASSLAGGTVDVTVTSGVVVLGCAQCEGPPVV